MAVRTSGATGNWNAGGTWVGGVAPGDGDSAIIDTGHVVTVTASQTVGPNGATGVAAITVVGDLVVNAPLILKGDLKQNGLRSVTGSCVGANTGSITFTPPAGSTYLWEGQTAGGGQGQITLTGEAGNPFIVTTTQGGGGNARFTALNWPPHLTFTHVKMSRFGDASNRGINLDGTNCVWNYVLFDFCGRIHTINNDANANWDINNVSVTNSLEPTYPFSSLHNVDKVGGTRRINNLTIYSATLKELSLQTRDLAIVGGLYLYNVKIGNSTVLRCNWDKLFMVADIANAEFISALTGKAANVLRNFIMYSRIANPHYILEAGADVLADNIIEDGFFDGDDFWSSDPGDCVVPSAACTIRRLLTIHKGGCLTSLLSATAILDAQNCTQYHSYGITIGETTGAATQIKTYKNNLIVDPYALDSPGDAPGSGLYLDTSAVKQSNFTLDYNGRWGALESGAAGPMGVPRKVVVASAVCQAGTTSTHVVGTGSPFTGVVAGDWVREANKGVARVQTFTDANTLELETGIGGLVPGDTVAVRSNYWATAGQKYGDANRGLNDVLIDPMFRDPSRSVASWSLARGGLGTIADVGAQIVKVNGWDKDGTAVTPDPNVTIDDALAYLRYGFTPTNPAVATAGEGGTYLGAIVPGASDAPPLAQKRPNRRATVMVIQQRRGL